MLDAQAPVTILVIEDDPLQNQLLSAFVESLGHRAISAFNGAQAEAQFIANTPDVIFIDYELPDTNGKTLVKRLRELESRWLPIVFVSAHNASAIQRECLLGGGDDFITKPFDYPILEAKVAAMVRIAHLQKKIHEQNTQLSGHIRRAKDENDAARYLYDRLIRTGQSVPEFSQQQVFPAEGFSGDLLAFNEGSNGHFYWLLADATGHGLTAAISLIPVTQVFYAMTQKGHNLSAIVAEMHRQLKRYTPSHRFVCATAIHVDPAHCSLSIWNGGMPDVLLISEQNRLLTRLFSKHMPLGLQGPNGFDATVEHYTYQAGTRLFACSDGVVEAANAHEECWGEKRLESLLLDNITDLDIGNIRKKLDGFLGDVPAQDDIALLLINLPGPQQHSSATVKQTDASQLAECAWNMELQGKHLRAVDPIPLAMTWLEHVHIHGNTRAIAHSVIQELVSNAIDHGLLELSSALKDGVDGFSRYLEARQERLNRLEHGQLFIQLQIVHQNLHWYLRMLVRDSGNGYDTSVAPTSALGTEGLTRKYGRGLALVRALSSDIEISPTGNQTIAIIQL